MDTFLKKYLVTKQLHASSTALDLLVIGIDWEFLWSQSLTSAIAVQSLFTGQGSLGENVLSQTRWDLVFARA